MKRIMYKEAAEWYYSLRPLRISMLFLAEKEYMTKKERNAERSWVRIKGRAGSHLGRSLQNFLNFGILGP